MLRQMMCVLAFACMVIAAPIASAQASAQTTCHGKFPNPLTDMCWDCIFPLSVGGAKLWPVAMLDTPNPPLPVCLCGIKPGLEWGFWEPVRLIDVTTKPWCFPGLGGITINPGLYLGTGHTADDHVAGGHASKTAKYQTHFYIYPIFALLEIVTGFNCFENDSFNIAYVTELDPTWQDDTLAAMVYPETVIFDNLISTAACTADCIASSVGLPLDALFWCAGCNGSMYPITGNVGNHETQDQSMKLAAERMLFKMHRTALAWGTMGSAGLCGVYAMPLMKKSQYRMQMVNPVPATSGPLACKPPGASTAIQLTNHVYPVVGEDVTYLVWRKRNCCSRAP